MNPSQQDLSVILPEMNNLVTEALCKLEFCGHSLSKREHKTQDFKTQSKTYKTTA